MSDPLSTFAKAVEEDEDIDIERDIEEELNTNDKGLATEDQDVPLIAHEDVNSGPQRVVESEGNEHSTGENKENTVEDVTRQDSFLSTNSDILAKIEEEMGTGPKDLDVVVENPEKVVKTMETFVAFSVKTKTTRSEFEDPEYNVKRRYNDFVWLRQQLEEKQPALIIPPLPEKHSRTTFDRFDKEFVNARQVALNRFMGRITAHPVTSTDEILRAFLTLSPADLQAFKKQSSGLLSRMSRSLSVISGSYMLKNRTEEYTSLSSYAQAFGDRMGALERITRRLVEEQHEYLTSLSSYTPAYENWASHEADLSDCLMEMSKLMSTMHDDYKSMADESNYKMLLPLREYILFSESIKGALTRRDAVQHELEVVSEELVKYTEEKHQLDTATPSSGGFLSRSSTEESIKGKLDKVSSKICELEAARGQCKAKLEERNLQLKTDLERWHINKKADMKELIGGMADRNIDMYDKHISSLEATLGELKKTVTAHG